MIRFENCLTPLKNASSNYFVNGVEFLLIMTFDLSLGGHMESNISPRVIFFLVCFFCLYVVVFWEGMTHKCPPWSQGTKHLYWLSCWISAQRWQKRKKNYQTSCPRDRTELSKFTEQFQFFSDNTLPHPISPWNVFF